MKRRKFIFRSLQSMLFLNPIFSIRLAEAQEMKALKSLFFIDGGSPYPKSSDWFPSTAGKNFNLPEVLRDFEALKNELTIVQGINIRLNDGPIRGNNHVTSMGRLLTARAPHKISTYDGLPGGISIDQYIARQKGHKSLELQVNHEVYDHMRSKPFASGDKQFVTPQVNPAVAFDNIFKNFQPGSLQGNTDAAQKARLDRLNANKSILDDMLSELRRFRSELVGIEKIKLDAHESSIRDAERSVLADIKTQEESLVDGVTASCKENWNKGDISSNYIPTRAKAAIDLAYAALACDMVGVASIIVGYSSSKWKYDWLNINVSNNSHDDIWHHASARRTDFLKTARWNWSNLASIATKLKNTPDGNGTLLDNVLVYGTSHFGHHHSINDIPIMLIGNAQGKLESGRVIKVNDQYHDKVLTSVGRLCAKSDLSGFGDYQNCGPLDVLYK